METALSLQPPAGLAAGAWLSQNSRLGSAPKNASLHQALAFAKPLTAPGLPDPLYDFRGGPRCSSKERDSETGLDYFGARYFSGAQGRWTTPDWSAREEAVPYADLHDPQTLNLYAYVRNNPLSRRDLDGHAQHCFLGICVGSPDPPPPPPAPPPPPPQALQPAQPANPQAAPAQGNPQVNLRPGVPAPAGQLQTLVNCIGNCARTPLTVTSTNEHVGGGIHGATTPHGRGEAVDLRAGSAQEADRLVGCAGQCGAGFALNEVRHPSAHATGPHVHVQVGPGRGGGHGDLPRPTPAPAPQQHEDE